MSLFNIYVIENDLGYIKIGITTNFKQRLQSLSGSNSGGNKIVRYFVSEETYLYSIEKTMHTIFHKFRISGTEWFKDISYEDVVEKLKELFTSSDYKKCNELRKKYNKNNKKENENRIEVEKNNIKEEEKTNEYQNDDSPLEKVI